MGHLGDTACIVRDRTVCIDCKGDTKGGQHTNGSDTDTVHAGKLVGNEDGN